MTTTRTHSTLDLSRFRFTCPAWHEGFERGKESQRREAVKEAATHDEWRRADWSRARINEGVEQ